MIKNKQEIVEFLRKNNFYGKIDDAGNININNIILISDTDGYIKLISNNELLGLYSDKDSFFTYLFYLCVKYVGL